MENKWSFTIGQQKKDSKHTHSTGHNEATHQVLITEPSELLKLLWYEELSTPYCTADRPQNYKDTNMTNP